MMFNALSRFIIERTYRGVHPAPRITAPETLAPELRAFSDCRARYIQQSAATVAGRVAPFPARRAQ